jgi:hypothetical protein
VSWHLHALEFRNGTAMPRGCQECGVMLADLIAALAPDEEYARLYVVPKDGILQMLCKPCMEAYLSKRKDIYGPTRDWHLGKIGRN